VIKKRDKAMFNRQPGPNFLSAFNAYGLREYAHVTMANQCRKFDGTKTPTKQKAYTPAN
jgi:hypothetical protein